MQVGGASGSGSTAHRNEVQRRLEKDAEIKRRGKEIREREFQRQLALVRAKEPPIQVVVNPPTPSPMSPAVYSPTSPAESDVEPTAEGRAAAERYALRRAGAIGSEAYMPAPRIMVPPPQLRVEDAPYPILDQETVKRDYKPVIFDLVEKVRAAQGRYVKRKSDKPQPFNIELLLHDSIPHLIQISSMLKSKALTNTAFS